MSQNNKIKQTSKGLLTAIIIMEIMIIFMLLNQPKSPVKAVVVDKKGGVYHCDTNGDGVADKKVFLSRREYNQAVRDFIKIGDTLKYHNKLDSVNNRSMADIKKLCQENQKQR